MLARAAEEVMAARHRDHLRHPVARRHQRIEPFDARERRASGGPPRAGRDRVHPRHQPPHQLAAARGFVERAGDALDVGEDVREPIRRERHDLRPRAEPASDRILDVALADRAYLALRLGDDDVGRKLAQLLRVDAIDRKRLAHDTAHLAVDFAARAVGIELGLGQRGQTGDGGREVAFVRAADQLRFEAERADDFGRARKKAYDSMHAMLLALRR